MKKLTEEEVLKLIKKVCDTEYNSEKECTDLLNIIRQNVPHPEVSNLIFKHKPELTPEQILEKALSYKPIILGP